MALEQGATMNTVGKILVVLNLLFALAAGAFIVLWKANDARHAEQNEQNVRLAQVMEKDARAYYDTARKLIDENNKLRADLDQVMINAKARQSELDAEIKRIDKEYRDQKVNAEKAILVKEQMIQEAKRLQAEVQLLNDVVAKREQAILTLQTDIKRYVNEAQEKQELARKATERNIQILAKLQKTEELLNKYVQGTTVTTNVPVTDPSYRNPPTAFVKGRIMKIDATDRTLVTVSVGSDVGVNKDNTLEVYRLQPQAEYLGRLLIREARHNEAVGRLMPSRSAKGALREGDVVASSTDR
jgi:hypothetical protein